ncbi:hypothetical protein LTR86_007195 [Recurvomyces mirabilis]|nr:hypothetical protein LTR86_007195 [Recurvomyces mirabilis]
MGHSTNKPYRQKGKHKRSYKRRENVRQLKSDTRRPRSNLGIDRTKRVKDARSEAQKEIEDYRKQKDEEFQSFEKEHTSGNKAAEEKAEKDIQAQLDEIKKIGQKTGPKVVDDLVKAVMDVHPEVPTRAV